MAKVKPYTLGNRFYPEDKEKLKNTLEVLFKEIPKDYNTTTRVLMVPHAAYKYSGLVAANAYQYLDKNVKNVFIFSPAHYLLFYGIALASYDKWATPLGEIEVNREIVKDIAEKYDADFNDRAYEKEHAIEVQIPFIQTILPQAKIVPILFGSSNFSRIEKIVEKYYWDKENAFISAADLTHFYSQQDAIKADEYDAEQLEEKGGYDLVAARSSFTNGLVAASEFARTNGYALIRAGLSTSGEIAGSDAKVEGYGSWFLVETSVCEFVKEQFSDIVIMLARNSIISGFESGTPIASQGLKLPPVFDSRGACFVEIFVDGERRGVSGTVFAYRPLKEDIIQNAYKALFNKDGNKVLQDDEIDKMEIEVCLLTRPNAIAAVNEEQFQERLEEGVDGVFLRAGEKEAVFLPGRWEKYPQKEAFFKALKEKAGLDPDETPKYLELYKFKAARIKS